jgi:hypothetical protein
MENTRLFFSSFGVGVTYSDYLFYYGYSISDLSGDSISDLSGYSDYLMDYGYSINDYLSGYSDYLMDYGICSIVDYDNCFDYLMDYYDIDEYVLDYGI